MPTIKIRSFVLTVLLVFVLNTVSFAAEPRPFFAFCMDTHDDKHRSIEQQNVLLKELGYDGVGHLSLKGLPERAASAKEHNLKLNQVYLNVDISKQTPFDTKLANVLPCIKGGETQLAVLVYGAKPSDVEQDEKIIGILRQIKAIADPLDVPVVLYPHLSACIERVDDAVRIAEKFQTEEPGQKIGVMFNLCHWAATNKSDTLESVLNLTKPYLAAVSINGLDTPEEIQAKKGNWIQPLDAGSFDVAVLLRLLDKIDYHDAVGLQCYGVPGDAKFHLTRSMNAWKKLNGKDSDAAKTNTARKYPFFGLCLEHAYAKKRNFDETSQLLKELGYDGVGHLHLKGLQERAASAKKHSLKVVQLYLSVDVSRQPAFAPELAQALECVKGSGMQLALQINGGGEPADTSLDDKAVEIIKQIKDIADPLGVETVIYPHLRYWLLTTTDAIRIADKYQKKYPEEKIGVMFNLAHWAETNTSDSLESTLTALKPYLASITINGNMMPEEIQAKKLPIYSWIRPLDAGEFDLERLFELLRKMDYHGPVGLQCYGIKGDAKDHLIRSMKAWQILKGNDLL